MSLLSPGGLLARAGQAKSERRWGDLSLSLAIVSLRLACGLLAAWFILCFIYVAAGSVAYPFHYEWMEGQNIDVMRRAMEGKRLYGPPKLDYVPYIYTPLFYYAAGFVAQFTGVDFLPARLVSTAATLGSAAVLFAWVRKERGGRLAALTAAGLFLSTYQLSGRWFDAARVDSLFMFLMLAGLFTFFHTRGLAGAAASAAVLTLAFFTKQTALMVAAPALLAGAWHNRRHAAVTALLLAAFVLAGVWLYDRASGGWFSFWVFTVPSGHGIARRFWAGFWIGDLSPVGGGLLAGGYALLRLWKQDRRRAVTYGGLAVGCLGAAWVSRLHHYGYMNVLMPVHAGVALMGGLGLARAQAPALRLALPAVLAAQLAVLLYDPAPMIPSAQSVEEGKRFLDSIERIEGDLFMPELQFVQTRVGKKSYAFGMAAFDLFRCAHPACEEPQMELAADLKEALMRGRWFAVMPGRLIQLPEMKGYYKPFARLTYPQEYVTGAINFLRTDIFVRISDEEKEPQP